MRVLIMLIILFPMAAFAAEGGFDWAAALSPGGMIAAAIVLVIEFIVGKTDLVKAGSILEIILNLGLKLLKKDTEI